MHLAVNAVGIKHSGGATVLLDFLTAALANEGVGHVSLFCTPRPERRFDLPKSQRLTVLPRPLAERSYLYRMLWSQYALEHECRRIGADVLVCLTGIGRTARLPQVSFIQQSLPFVHDAYTGATRYERIYLTTLRSLMRRACGAADRVIVQTPTMRTCLVAAFGLDPSQVQAILPQPPPAPAPVSETHAELAPMAAAPAHARLLYVGSHERYKNVETIIEAMAVVRQTLHDATLFLTWPPDHPSLMQSGVVGLGYLSGDRLWQAYRLATAVALPSLAETVGFPMLEAMSQGTPVLAADRPYARDVCGRAASYFDPLSAEDFAKAAVELMTGPGLRETLSADGIVRSAQLQGREPYSRMVAAALAASGGRSTCVG